MPLQHAEKFDLQKIKEKSHIWAICALVISTLFPQEVRLTILGIDLFPFRIVFLIFLPYTIRYSTKLATKPIATDVFVFSSAIWVMISSIYHNGPLSGIIHGLSATADLLAGYVTARASIRNINDFRRVLVVTAPFFLIAGLIVMTESLSGHIILKPVVEAYFPRPITAGIVSTSQADYALRLGLFRGVGTFPHAILAGLYLATLLPIYAYSRLRGWPLKIGLAASALAFFSVSSTAILSILITFILISLDKLVKFIKQLHWTFLISIFLFTLFCIQLVFTNGIFGLMVKISLDGWTAYYRYITYKFATKASFEHPLFGIGDGNFDRPAWMISTTVDSFWLLQMLNYGIFSMLTIFAATITVIYELAKATASTDESDSFTVKGIAFSLSVIIFGGTSVAFFGSFPTWFGIILGSGANCAFSIRNSVIRAPQVHEIPVALRSTSLSALPARW